MLPGNGNALVDRFGRGNAVLWSIDLVGEMLSHHIQLPRVQPVRVHLES